VLRHYERAWFRADLIAGLTVGAMLIPQSMSYAALADLPPEYGFAAAVPALVVYAMVGTSRHLGVGPEPGTAILAAAGVGSIVGAQADPSRYAALMAALAAIVAVLCVAAWMLRLGQMAAVLSKPVLVGYIAGVGLTLLSSQIGGFTGLRIEADSFVPRLTEAWSHAGDVHWPTVAVGAATWLVIVAARKVTPNAPSVLIGVAVAAAVVAAARLDERGVQIVGAIPSAVPTFGLPSLSLSDIRRLLPVAAGVTIVGFADNVLTARAIAAGRGYRVDENQELLALGLTNMASSVFHGFPMSSSASRTAVPASLGSRTQLVSLIAAGCVLFSVIVAPEALGRIPRSALAAVVIVAALSIIDLGAFATLWTVSRDECVLAILACAGVVVLGVFKGIVVAVVMSGALAAVRLGRRSNSLLSALHQPRGVDGDQADSVPGLLLFRFGAPVLFFNAARFRRRLAAALAADPTPDKWVVIVADAIGQIDVSGVDMLRDLVAERQEHGVEVFVIAAANPAVSRRLARAGLLEPHGAIRLCPSAEAAVAAFHARFAEPGNPPC
jgi:sulfate permease, SulP family